MTRYAGFPDLNPDELRHCLRHVVEIPRQVISPEQTPDPDPFGLQRFAAFVSSFHSRTGPVVWAWHRSARHGPVALLTSHPSVMPAASVFAPADALVDELLAAPSWVGFDGRHDGLINLDKPTRPNRTELRPSLESCLLSIWDGPFTLLLVAEPVLSDDAADAVERAADAARHAKQRAESSPDREVEYDRMKAWHRELREGESTGLWRIRLRVGAPDTASARAVAGLTIASYDLADSGYALVPSESPDSKGFLAGSRLLATLVRPPSVEIPGVRLALLSEFDVTPESTSGVVELGTVLDREKQPAGPLRLSLESLNRHTFVCGATGSGKSQTTRHLLEMATAQGIPWLVVEPAKAEYKAMATRLPDHEVIVVRPGDPDQVACGIDPMRPAKGFPLQTHLDLTRALFLAAFEADEPFPQVLSAALTRAYEQQGWNISLSESDHAGIQPRYPTLADLQSCARQIVDEVGYGQEVADNIRGFVKVRLSSLRLGTTGRFLEGGHPLDISRLLESNVVLEIEDVGDDHDKAFIMGTVLIALTEHYRVAERNGLLDKGKLRHLTVFEEAHRLLRNTERAGAAAQAVEMFAALLAEVRAYGEGLVIAEQIPAKLIPDVIKNTAVKVVHRLPAKDDRDAVGATMNLSDAQSAYLVTVPPGTAGVFSDGMDNPVLTRMPDGTHAESTNQVCPAGPDAIVAPTFGRCGADYGLRGITLTKVVRGQRLVEQQPLVRWWAELAVLGHLVGRAVPLRSRTLMTGLLGHHQTTVDCALAYAVDEAVAARSSLVADRMAPSDLAAHVTRVLIGVMHGEQTCAYSEFEWLASGYRWEPIWTDLRKHIDADPDCACGQPHPRTQDWKDRYGISVPGRTCAEQRDAVQGWRHKAQIDRGVEDLAFGLANPSALETSVNAFRSDLAELAKRVNPILDELHAQWADRLLLLGSQG